MEDLLTSQQQLMGAIEQLFSNFKKDGADRKTPSYIKKRLSSLEAYWHEFQCNHKKLEEFNEQGHDYYTSKCFERTADFYTNSRVQILKYLPTSSIALADDKPLTGPASPLTSATRVSTPQPPARAGTLAAANTDTINEFQITRDRESVSSKLQEMLNDQRSNFKALAKTLSSINLDAGCDKWEYEDELESLQTRWLSIDKLHWQIDRELGGEENPEYEEMYGMYENQYIYTKRSIKKKMWAQNHRQQATPQMDIPTFAGNYHEWLAFKNLFIETIHTNNSLSSAQKLQYLKNKLKGEAEKLINHLHITPENYEISWEILNNRYNNMKLIINSHLSALVNMPNIQNQPSAQAIKRVHDVTNEALNGIKTLKIDISSWDPFVVYIVTNKLDADTHNEYLQFLKCPRDVPSLKELLSFLELKFTSLESSRRKQETKQYNQKQDHPNNFSINKSQPNFTNKSHNTYKAFYSNTQNCPVCNNDHMIFDCEKFLQSSPEHKKQIVEKNSLCRNCLYKHGKQCFSYKRCRVCQQDHNTLLHDIFGAKRLINHETRSMAPNRSAIPYQPTQQRGNAHVLQEDAAEILLATALVQIQAADGSWKTMRALVDQGSQTSLITENAAQILQLRRRRCKGVIFGVGTNENNCKGALSITLSSIHNDYSTNIDVLIMNNLINSLPNRTFEQPKWSCIKDIPLADPEFYISRPVDLLLGADIYSNIILEGIIKMKGPAPVAQQTQLGWILCGNTNIRKSFHCNVVLIDEEEMHRFWSIEDVTDNNSMSTEEKQCVDFYKSTTQRKSDGRYQVRLPLHCDFSEKIGASKSQAIAQFYQLERKFTRNQNIAADYKAFINEYINLGHMHLATTAAVGNMTPSHYLPHHCVHRADSRTTSLRVVFNASQSTTSGLSLNDVMHRGPNLQQDLLSLVLRWRQYRIAFTADIEKMFRQIWVHPDEQRYQKIVWRDTSYQPLRAYQLATVTYGTKAAPFLAMMTLRQLANDERKKFPEAAKVVESQFYMDDVLSGGDSIAAAKQLQKDLIELLQAGGFNLRKWSSNDPGLIQSTDTQHANFDFKHQESTKALGLTWKASKDVFIFKCKITTKASAKLTKRSLLSDISKIFDPLGWLSPVVVQFKILFQEVWIAETKWDDEVPPSILDKWLKLTLHIDSINHLEIPRWIGSKDGSIIELHGFCDASQKAYAAVVYARITDHSLLAKATIIAAKTKVVPISKSAGKISLPRLELCGAVLLSKLIIKITECLSSYNIKIYGWCDSTAVLGWLKGDPSKWKPFVSNRVKQITQCIAPECWRYVKTDENPADCATRGVLAGQLKQHPLWWTGPTWLTSFDSRDEKNLEKFETTLESKTIDKQIYVTTKMNNNSIIEQLITKHSSFTRVTRVLAWILRVLSRDTNKDRFLTSEELRTAKLKIIKHVQQKEFSEEISSLQQHGRINSKSTILPLNPFLDKNGLLRVCGRLENANINMDMKHPLIIPHSSHLTDLLIDYAHKQTFHGGARLTLSRLRQQYWILGGNRAVKKRLHQCVLCKRHNPRKQDQLMPEARTNPSRPFYHTGVDFTGFVDVKSNAGRGIKTTKGYIAVFVCMVTKCIHLELVSNLSASAFLAAVRRLAARRGAPRHIYSDNGTNFVGANRMLQQEYINIKSVLSEAEEFMSEVSEMQITWHFNAPSWPNAGGLWEAAVKSLKHHLRRVVGEQKLTYEEYATLLAQLEACLNTRPLCAISEDPNDLDYLTPSHFLASGPILTIVETERDNRTRWQLTQRIFKDIWKRWRTEYLTQMASRSKWQESKSNVKIDDVMIIQDANLPPGKWALGRVTELHPGKDGYVRVVSLKTKGGYMKRPIVKLSPLTTTPRADFKTEPAINSTSSTHNININKRRKKPPLASKITSAITMMLFLIFVCATTAVHGAYNTTSLQGNNGLYFDKLSNMRLIQDQWKFVVYYDMDPFWQGRKMMNTYVTHLESLCSSSEYKSHCNIIILQLQHGLEELSYYDEILLNQRFDHTNNRHRRGLINGVGYIANSLFGVLDEHFAEQYQKDIATIRYNQKHTNLLLKNQTSIIEAENNLLKRVESNMEAQYKIFNQHLISLDKITTAINHATRRMEIINEFLLSSIIANNVLTNLKSIQDTLIETITDIKHYNIHLLSPTQFRNEISIIYGHISRDLTLPVDNIQPDIVNLYKILRVRARMTQTHFIFEIKIPLVSRDNYELYKLYPIPRYLSNEMVSISPITNYLAVDIRKDTYIPISENELHRCIELDTSTHLCELQKAIFEREKDEELCIKNINTAKCKTTHSTCQITWTELVNVNNFLVSCCGQCSLRIICESQVSTAQITNVSIISIGPDCVIKGEFFTVTSHRRYENDIIIKPELMAVNIPPINHYINLTIPQSPQNTYEQNNSLADAFEQIRNGLDQAKKDIDAANDEDDSVLSFHDIHHYIAIYAVAALVLACAACAWIRACRRRAANPPPAPAPSPAPAVHVIPVPTPAPVPASVPTISMTCDSDNSDQCKSKTNGHGFKDFKFSSLYN